ncbi:MAG TPA: hypothetical protein P5056_00305 [Candidatus Paceibacterota bacterium]|nr:hypothetical protein [Candidatus Paceibacterota bacterium]
MRKQPFKDFISGAGSRAERPVHKDLYEEVPRRRTPVSFSLDKKSGKRFFSATSTKTIISVSTALLLAFIWFSSAYSSVVVKVTPISENVSMDDAFVAVSVKDAVKDGVVFKTMKVEENDSLPIAATESKAVSQKASGEIVVYNNYSTASQKLVAGTRFESSDGKIFKIDKAVTIPGKQTVSGKLVPGSLTVTVYAAEAGKEYNIKASDYTLPGLKGSPRYTSVYGRGKGDMSGGYVGEMKIVSPTDVALTKKKLEDSLTKKLREKIASEVPAGYIVYEDAMFVDFEDNIKQLGSEWEGDKVYLKMKGSAGAFMFDMKELATAMTKKKLPSLNNYDVHSNELPALEFKILVKEGVSPDSSKMFTFKLNGDAKVTWNLDVDNFKKDLLGIKKENYQDIFKKYPTIEKAETIFNPSWSGSFPDEVGRITVELIED